MSILKNLIEDNEANFKSDFTGKQSLNLPIKVQRFDGETVIGERLDTGEIITLQLNTFQKKENSEFDRPSISKLANNGKKSVQLGGVIQFENAYDDGGIWKARWPRVVAKNEEGDTKTFCGKTRVFFGQASSGTKFIEIKMVFTDRAKKVETLDELKAYLLRHLVPNADGVVNNTTIKLKDGESEYSVEARAQLVDLEDDYGNKRRQVNPNAHQSVEAFLASKGGTLVASCFEAETPIEISFCNGATLYVGKDTKENTLKKEKAVQFTKQEFMLEKEGVYSRENIGYKDVVVGIRTDGNQKYVTHFLSLNSYDEPTPESKLF